MQLCSKHNAPTLWGLRFSAIDFSPNVPPAWNSHFSHQAHSAQNEREREIVGWKQASKQQQPLLTLFLPTFTQTGAVLRSSLCQWRRKISEKLVEGVVVEFSPARYSVLGRKLFPFLEEVVTAQKYLYSPYQSCKQNFNFLHMVHSS